MNIDQFDLNVVRPIGVIVWILASFSLYRIADGLLAKAFLFSAMIIVLFEVYLQLVRHEIIVVDSREEMMIYVLYGIVAVIDNIFIIMICRRIKVK